jgi:hypothetical protein
MAALAMYIEEMLVSSGEVGFESQVRWGLEKSCGTCGQGHHLRGGKHGGNVFHRSTLLFANWKVAACIVGKVNYVSLKEATAVVVTNYSAVGFGHPVGPDKLLRGEKVDGALWNIKTVHFNGNGGAVIGSQCPRDEAVSHNRELGSDATYASIRRGWSEPIWEVERIVADGNRATTVKDNGGVVGGEWGDRGCLIGNYCIE